MKRKINGTTVVYPKEFDLYQLAHIGALFLRDLERGYTMMPMELNQEQIERVDSIYSPFSPIELLYDALLQYRPAPLSEIAARKMPLKGHRT